MRITSVNVRPERVTGAHPVVHPRPVTIEELLRRQAGLVTRAQATGAGISIRTVQRRVASGVWTEIRPGVYLVGGHRLTDEVRVRSAWLWAGPESLVAGSAAAYWHGLPARPPLSVDLAVRPGFRRRVPPGIHARRRDVPSADRSVLRGIGVTGLGLTVLDTVAVLSDAATFLDRALQRHISFAELHAAYCRAAGTRGMARAGDLLVVAADRADSALERRLVRLLRAAGIDGFVRGMSFGRREIDLAFPQARLAVEIDGWAWHSDTDRFRADRVKGNDLVAAGWTLLRFTWRDITEHPEATVARVRDALARAA